MDSVIYVRASVFISKTGVCASGCQSCGGVKGRSGAPDPATRIIGNGNQSFFIPGATIGDADFKDPSPLCQLGSAQSKLISSIIHDAKILPSARPMQIRNHPSLNMHVNLGFSSLCMKRTCSSQSEYVENPAR